MPLGYLRELCEYWADGYDWRVTEARPNELPQYRTEIDGLGIHFVHLAARRADALPLLLTHGWPGSVAEFSGVIRPLAEAGFHVVCPSSVIARDLLGNVSLYWFTGTGAASDTVDVPVGCTVFPHELQRPSRRWAARRFTDIRYWSEPDAGGHFPALEQPARFVTELTAFFRLVG